MRNAGEIEIIFDRRLTDRLKVLLLIDNGGWSMEPYVETVQTLFHYARSQFKDLSIRYFHNTVTDRVWRDPERRSRPETVEELLRRDPETRLIFVGDASMAPEELLAINGSIAIEYRQQQPSIERLKMLAATFRHAAWFNPISSSLWHHGETISLIRTHHSHVRAESGRAGKRGSPPDCPLIPRVLRGVFSALSVPLKTGSFPQPPLPKGLVGR